MLVKVKNISLIYAQQPHQHWIPNREKDTLVAIGGNSGFYLTDVMYSETINDTSVIYYRNEKYYIWTENVKHEPFKAYYHFSPDRQSYNEVVSKIPFTYKINEFYLEAYSVQPSAYYDSVESRWKEQAQVISLVRMPDGLPIGVRSSYSTANKQFLD